MASQREQEWLEVRRGWRSRQIEYTGKQPLRAIEPLRARYCVRGEGTGCTHKYQAVAEHSGS